MVGVIAALLWRHGAETIKWLDAQARDTRAIAAEWLKNTRRRDAVAVENSAR